ncbi:MAG: tRNA (adenosine(37)-N6)-threonylcarbamoyltransferase complex ATPase subunit type 1 TsaE [Patescibacteria group bacterium]|jgi:tRNA threonylcarbamoyladenosine biosynthesis protein TsaE
MPEYLVNNQRETEAIATKLAKNLKGGELLALSGNLGAGKTVFVQALAKALGIKENITSPTFVLMKVYDLKKAKINKFVHVDCYRLYRREDLLEIGLEDYLIHDNIIVAIEWADKLRSLPDRAIKINIELLKDNKRKITIN